MKRFLSSLLVILTIALFLAGCGSSKKSVSVQSGSTDENYRGVIYQDSLQGQESGKPNI